MYKKLVQLFSNKISQMVSTVLRIGVTPEDSDDLRLSKVLGTTSVLFSAIPFMFLWSPLFFFFNEPLLAIIGVGYGAIAFIALAILHRWPKSFRPVLISLNIEGVIGIWLVSFVSGGFLNSGGVVMWLLMPIIGAIIQIGPRYAFALFLVFLGELSLIILLPQLTDNLPNSPNWLQLAFLLNNLAGVSAFVFFIVYYFIRQRNLAFNLLRGEQAKSEKLLLNILPKEIAEILKNENRVVADHYDEASILFADVVNFTPLSATMTPTELVELLNEVFSHFDILVESHGLEKIKTIGDCYMVASGVPRPRADHAQVVVRMALEMLAYVDSREFMGRKLAFRIGINSGPVVAGVIGRTKFIYDLWGDAVNTASRMESHGAVGIIQITEATRELIKDNFICESRGTVYVKGKGQMNVWQVLEEKA
jgi:guanylate cyclase